MTFWNGSGSWPIDGRIFHLDLRGIGLERFPEEKGQFFSYEPREKTFRYATHGHHIDIADNPFYCDCQPSDETYYEDINNCTMPDWAKDGLIGVNRDGIFPMYSSVTVSGFEIVPSGEPIEGEFMPTPWIIGFDNRDCSASPGGEE